MPRYGDKVVPFRAPAQTSRQRTGRRVAPERVLNVLVIGGSPEDRTAVRIALEPGGFALQEAADAAHGVRLAGSSAPDCILLGEILPDADGLDVLESLHDPEGGLACAVVMLTEAGTADAATAAIKAGALDYVVKDHLDSYTLRRAIRGAVREFRLIEAQRAAERRNAQLAALVDASEDAIIGLGTDLVVQTWNAGAQRLFGYSEAEARGRPIAELIVPDACADELVAIGALSPRRSDPSRMDGVCSSPLPRM